MKTAIVVSAQPTAFEALALSADLEQSFDLIAAEGFSGVEIAVRDPERVDAKSINRLARDKGLEIVAIGTGQAYVDEGLSLTYPEQSVRDKALARMKKQLELARKLGAMVIIGLIRGNPGPGDDLEQAKELFADALRELSEYGQSIQAKPILIEPLNRYEARLINSVDEGLGFLNELELPNVKLLADTFHMNIEDRDMAESLRAARGVLGHVHIADSNRHAPGQGHTDFGPVLAALDDIGYSGYVSVEIMPVPTPEDAVRLTAEFFRSLNRS